MSFTTVARVAFVALAIALCGCASRPINPRIDHADPDYGYRTDYRIVRGAASDTVIILAFSGGGTRAAAFSYGVLEELRRMQIKVRGKPTRLLHDLTATPAHPVSGLTPAVMP